MSEHVLETRILLRYDTYNNWMISTLILKCGEVAIATFPYSNSITSSDSTPSNTPPAIGLKVGDGESYFYELPWVQAVAGDVYNWAKQPVKPSYSANEIEGLESFIEQHSSGGGSGGGDTPPSVASRIYQLVRGSGDNINKYYLQYRNSDESNWTIDTSVYIDLSQYAKLYAWVGSDINDYFTLRGAVFDAVQDEFFKKNYTDYEEAGKVVSAVSESNGIISVTKKALNLNEFSGVLSASQGGTGVSTIGNNEILVGNSNGTFSTRLIETELDANTNLATNAAIKTYIDTKTAGLTGAMHYIGEAAVEINPAVNPYVDPLINGYNFRNVQAGDVVTYNTKEYVWADGWKLLGDEGSYAVKGSIVDADISADAAIQQSKILNLTESLADKVDVVEGKQLSTNDYTNAEKNKLAEIEAGAQVNAIEHIFVNDNERPIVTIGGLPKSIALSIDVFDAEHAEKLDGIETGAQVNAIEHVFVNGVESIPTTINNLTKSVNVTFNPFTDAEKLKLQNIEAGAQVNTIETIIINGASYTGNNSKEAIINLDAVTGARVPLSDSAYEDVTIATVNGQKKLELARIAKTGNVQDILQTSDTYITLYCGSSTEVI